MGQAVYTVGMLEKGRIRVQGGVEQDGMRFYQDPQDGIQLNLLNCFLWEFFI